MAYSHSGVINTNLKYGVFRDKVVMSSHFDHKLPHYTMVIVTVVTETNDVTVT